MKPIDFDQLARLEGMLTEPHVQSRVFHVTPEVAEAILSTHNTLNRPVRWKRVANYARDIIAGNWKLTHQGIGFARSGALIDGQHRLFAIAEAKVGAAMLVTTGVPDDARDAVDEGMVREVIDVIQLTGVSNAVKKMHVAVTRYVTMGTSARAMLTRSELIEQYKRHGAAVHFAVDDAFEGKQTNRITTAPFLAVFARAYYHTDPETLRRAAQVMRTGFAEAGRDAPLILLRNWLMSGGNDRGKLLLPREVIIYCKSQRALRAFIASEPLSRLYVDRNDAFPLPACDASQ